MILPLLLAGSLVAPTCTGTDILRGVGRFEAWEFTGTDDEPAGWEHSASGNGVKRAVYAHSGAYGAGFQTVFGPGSLTAYPLVRNNPLLTLSAFIGGQEPRTLSIRVQDTVTGRYLNALGEWQDDEADAIVQAAVVGYPEQPQELSFIAEATHRPLRVEIRSAQFGTCGPDGLCDCSPGLCPTGWADDVRLCAR